MKHIPAESISGAVAQALPYLLDIGVEETSRNGKVLVAPSPVMTTYNNPKNHVLFSATRNANPFFHLMEAMWMLAGQNDLKWPMQFNKRFAEYSDDGDTIWGAYGFRWRHFFGFDQLVPIYHELKNNPNSRRAVLSMWAPDGDLTEFDDNMGGLKSKDVPCNTHAYFDLRGGKLNMTVCNRSNDAIWGAYGANVVHFSILLEYMAEQLGVPMGVYRQFSNNFHAYTDIYGRDALKDIADESYTDAMGPYPTTIPLGSLDDRWAKSLFRLLDNGEVDWSVVNFFSQVAGPMYHAWFARKNGNYTAALDYLEKMPYCDWKIAATEWMIRMQEKKQDAA